MVADFRRKPSRARQEAVRKEREVALDRVVDEELRRAWNTPIVGVDFGFKDTEPVVVERPKPKEPLPMLKKPEREVTTFRGGKWAKPEPERHSDKRRRN